MGIYPTGVVPCGYIPYWCSAMWVYTLLGVVPCGYIPYWYSAMWVCTLLSVVPCGYRPYWVQCHVHNNGSNIAHSRFSVLLEYHQAFTLPPAVLLSLVDTIANQGQPQKAGTSPQGDSGASDLTSAIFSGLRELLDQSIEVLSNHFVTIDVGTSVGVEAIKNHLLWVINHIDEIIVFTYM